MLGLLEEKYVVLCRTRTGRSRGSQDKLDTSQAHGAVPRSPGPQRVRRSVGDSREGDTSGNRQRNVACSGTIACCTLCSLDRSTSHLWHDTSVRASLRSQAIPRLPRSLPPRVLV